MYSFAKVNQMVNQSKINDQRFWRKWKAYGADATHDGVVVKYMFNIRGVLRDIQGVLALRDRIAPSFTEPDFYDTQIDGENKLVVLSIYKRRIVNGNPVIGLYNVHLYLDGKYRNLNQLEVAVRQSFAHMYPDAKAEIPREVGRKY